MMEAQNVFRDLGSALRRVGYSLDTFTESLARLNREFILMFALDVSGDWPDHFILINRYLRTDRIPQSISGARWEA